MKLPPLSYTSRERFVLDRCSGRRVLHVGCVGDRDLAPGEQPLHAQLAERCRELWGIDISATGLKTMRAGLPGPSAERLLLGDAEHLDRVQSLPADFEVILAGDILEHLANPGLFLEGARRRLAPDGQILVTTPNAFGLMTFLRLLRGHEAVNPTHTCWFSVSSLSRLAAMHGLDAHEFATAYDYLPRRGFGRWKILLGRYGFRMLPVYGGTLIAVLSLKRPTS